MTNRFRKATVVAREMRAAAQPGSPSWGTRLAAVPRMIRAVRDGRYTGITNLQLLGLMAGAVYVVSPVDLVPEAGLLALGLADDLLVLGWLARALVRETEAFLDWERTGAYVRGETVQDAMPGEYGYARQR